MSSDTLAGIGAAIRAHLADQGPDAILTDWFVAYGSMQHDSDAADGISYGTRYSTSGTSPHGALGVATLGVSALQFDLSPDVDDD